MGRTLNDTRVNSCIKPIAGEDIAIAYREIYADNIRKNIESNATGSYLIGGMRGVGKSSLVNIALNYMNDKKTLIINSKLTDIDTIDELIPYLIFKIYDELIDVICQDLKDDLIELYNFSRVSKEEKENTVFKIKNTDSISENNNKNIIAEAGGGLSTKFINLVLKYSQSMEKAEKRNSENNSEVEKIISITYKQSKMVNLFIEFLEKVINKEYKIIFIYDEIDKTQIEFFEEIFNKYKDLFLNYDIFNFFIVNEKQYLSLTSLGDGIGYFNCYFNDVYYIPSFNYLETMRYSYLMYDDCNLENQIVLYYHSIGLLRRINQSYACSKKMENYANQYKYEIIKGYIFLNVIKEIQKEAYEKVIVDLLKVSIKIIIETIFNKKKIEFEYLEHIYKENKLLCEKYLDFSTLINIIIKLSDNNIEQKDNYIVFKKSTDWHYLHEQCNNIINKLGGNKIDISNLNPDIEFDELSRFGKGCVSENTKFHKIIDGSPYEYNETMLRIIDVYIDFLIGGVIIEKKLDGELGYNIEYSFIIFIEKYTFDVAYYVEEGIFDIEYQGRIFKVKEYLEKYNIKYITLKYDYFNCIEDIKEDIIKKFNR